MVTTMFTIFRHIIHRSGSYFLSSLYNKEENLPLNVWFRLDQYVRQMGTIRSRRCSIGFAPLRLKCSFKFLHIIQDLTGMYRKQWRAHAIVNRRFRLKHYLDSPMASQLWNSEQSTSNDVRSDKSYCFSSFYSLSIWVSWARWSFACNKHYYTRWLGIF